jgi:hypothetical protein
MTRRRCADSAGLISVAVAIQMRNIFRSGVSGLQSAFGLDCDHALPGCTASPSTNWRVTFCHNRTELPPE